MFTQKKKFLYNELNQTGAEYVLLFSELHDVKEKEALVVKNFLINSAHLYSIEKSRNR